MICGTGGTPGTGGKVNTGGTPGTGGGGGSTTTQGPCDIYAAEGGPCVAAHSTVRALLGAYIGPLYQVRRADGTSKDIPVLAPGGFADSSVQDAFCGSSACTISIIYDQSGKGNHLTKAPPGGAKVTGGNEADSKALPITMGGRKVYGEHNPPGVGYRNSTAVGTATGDDPETMYMITSGDYYNSGCCFDYGNAETNNHDNGNGTMEAIYFGNCTIWGKGAGIGPWVMGDLENGLWAGNTTSFQGNAAVTGYQYVTAMVKGDKAGANHWTIKNGNAQSGSLTKAFDGPRPSTTGYNPMKKEGAIILGISGDNSNGAQGNFFEGLMTSHYSSDAADDAVQANIVAAYGNTGGAVGTGGTTGSGGGGGGSTGTGGSSGACGDPAVKALYASCRATQDSASCTDLGGVWRTVGAGPGGTCVCPTGEGGCPCMASSDCLGACSAWMNPYDASSCNNVTSFTCTSTGGDKGCWCRPEMPIQDVCYP